MEVNIISKSNDKKGTLINDEITGDRLLVISETGEQLGELSRLDALNLADERGYDLVCVAPDAKIQVCKLMDYSKFRYDQIKRAKEAKKNQKRVEVKEVRISPTIDTHDFETKVRNAKKFLSSGDKVKVSCRFRGRMIEYANQTKELFHRFANGLEELSIIDQQPLLDGRQMFMMLSPKQDKKNK